MMRWLARFIAGLWSFSRGSWVSVGDDLRPRSRASALYLFLFLLFAVIGFVLIPIGYLFGFDLNDVDRWIDAQGGWLDAIGSGLFRLVCWVIFAIAMIMVLIGGWQRFTGEQRLEYGEIDQRLGWGAIICAAIVGYFAWFGMIGSA